MNNAVFIIGSGPSILEFSEEEKRFLNDSPATIALNKYLMYWETVGVLPKAMFQSDAASHVSRIVAAETMKITREIGAPITYFLHGKLIDLFSLPPLGLAGLRALRYRYQFWRWYGYWLPLHLDTQLLKPIKISGDQVEFSWASHLDQPLYHYRGSLTSAINLAAVLYPQADIKLLGIDMTGYKAFYELESLEPWLPRYTRYQKYQMVKQNPHHKKSQKMDAHVTAVERDGKPGVQTIIPRIREHLQSEGRDLYCCNPHSLLVTENTCAYRPIME